MHVLCSQHVVALPLLVPMRVLSLYVQMRKVCNHPYLFLNHKYELDETLVRASGKFELLNRMLPKLRFGGHRLPTFLSVLCALLCRCFTNCCERCGWF